MSFRRQTRVHGPTLRTSSSALRQIPKSLEIRLDQNPAPVSFALEEEGVAQVDPVPGSGLDEEAVPLSLEVVVHKVGLVQLAVFYFGS